MFALRVCPPYFSGLFNRRLKDDSEVQIETTQNGSSFDASMMQNGQQIGSLEAGVYTDESMIFWVESQQQGKGCGHALVDTFVQHLDPGNEIHLASSPQNEGFWAKLGFKKGNGPSMSAKAGDVSKYPY